MESSFIPISDVIYEHRLYLPSIGFVSAVSSGLFFLVNFCVRRTVDSKFRDVYLTSVFTVLLIGITASASFATYRRNKIWKDDFTLWSDVAAKTPNKARPLNNLGQAYAGMGMWKEALGKYEKALTIRSGNPEIYFRIYSNIAKAHARLKHWPQASQALKNALKIKPDDYKSHNNLSIVYDHLGLSKEAIAETQSAIKLKPDIPEPYNNLGLAYASIGQYQKAIEEYGKAIRLKPDYPDARYNLGSAYARQGRWQEAVREWETVLSIDPDHKETRNILERMRGNGSQKKVDRS